MKDRLRKIMDEYGFTPSKFAIHLEVQASCITHLLGGRNNPNYDFITKVITKFPDVSPDWLLLGTGTMFRMASVDSNKDIEITPSSHVNAVNTEIKTKEAEVIIEDVKIINDDKPNDTIEINKEAETKIIKNNQVEHILIFYNDATFKQYNPR